MNIMKTLVSHLHMLKTGKYKKTILLILHKGGHFGAFCPISVYMYNTKFYQGDKMCKMPIHGQIRY